MVGWRRRRRRRCFRGSHAPDSLAFAPKTPPRWPAWPCKKRMTFLALLSDCAQHSGIRLRLSASTTRRAWLFAMAAPFPVRALPPLRAASSSLVRPIVPEAARHARAASEEGRRCHPPNRSPSRVATSMRRAAKCEVGGVRCGRAWYTTCGGESHGAEAYTAQRLAPAQEGWLGWLLAIRRGV